MRLSLRYASCSVLAACLLSASCAPDHFEPENKPAELIVDKLRVPVPECETFHPDDKFGGADQGERRGTGWWKTKVWRTSQDCEISLSAYVYRSPEDAEESFNDFPPEVVFGDSWPWEPLDVDSPKWVGADQVEVICLGGDSATGCKDWYYWAQYGEVLMELEFFNVDTEGIEVTKEQFFAIVRQVDGASTPATRAN